MPSTFLTAEWRKLIMAQYSVQPQTLAPWLPPGVELDLFHGACFVSLIGFLFDRVRIKGVAFPFHTRFEEVNLRFYVRRVMPDGTARRGVVFIREFVPKMAITVIANSLYEEPYATLPMRRSIQQTADALRVSYGWRHQGSWCSMAAEADPKPQPIQAGSVEEFITEHYFGYTKRTRGATSEYAVGHPRWEMYPVRSSSIGADLGMLYGEAFAMLDADSPENILLAEGSAITVSTGTRLPLG